MKTAMQQLIERLERRKDWNINFYHRSAISSIIRLAEQFLATEKEQIIEAFKAGFRDGRKYFEMEEKYESAEDYYGKNFKQQ